MLQVRKDLCIGCGLCAENCPQLAIQLFGRQAEIDQTKCNRCRLCMEICPQGAIAEAVAVPVEELQTTVIFLKQKTDELIGRIERLKYCSSSRAKKQVY